MRVKAQDLLAGTERTSKAMNEVKNSVQGSMAGAVGASEVKLKLTLRICLSFDSKPYDPLGFVLPMMIVRNILFRRTIHSLKKGRQGKYLGMNC